jgi:hypothetical protein
LSGSKVPTCLQCQHTRVISPLEPCTASRSICQRGRRRSLAPACLQGPLPPTPSKSPGSKRQQGLAIFFKQTAKCLSCKQPIKQQQQQQQQQQQAPAPAPALCNSCQLQAGCWARTLLGTLQDDSRKWQQLCRAEAACLACNSGGHAGPVVCENGECPALYPRLAAARALAASEGRLERPDAHYGW